MRFFNKIEIPASVGLLEELRSRTGCVTKKGHKLMFLTISPNPSTRHIAERALKNGKLKKYNLAYKLLTHNEQHAYLQSYIKSVYIDYLDPNDWIYYVFETNSDNNLHLHAIMYCSDIQSEYDLKCLQKTIYANPKTIMNLPKKNASTNRMPKDYMNNIFYVNNDDKTKDINQKIEYLTKQSDIKEVFPDCTFGF